MRRDCFEHDPLAVVTAPPTGESLEERRHREAAEVEAKKISNEIDEQLKREKEAEKRRKKPVKLLLLGQSESGKTATLKTFQMTYAKREWLEERASWRAVIWLNMIRNVNVILDNLNREMSESSYVHSEAYSDEDSDDATAHRSARALPSLRFTEKHRILRQRLNHFFDLQKDLERRLGAASTEIHTTTVTTAAPFDVPLPPTRRPFHEFSVNSNNGWKSAFDKFRTLRSRTDPEDNITAFEREIKYRETEIAAMLADSQEDIKALWDDNVIREMLTRRKIRLEDRPGFFLNEVERIASVNYEPIDEDVIRARLRTLGVQEYKFIFDHGRAVGREWRIYDVGGTRSTRAAWYPYFEDVDAIIFLAPISPFNEKLAEDRRVNRLEDSYLLWRSVCGCKSLAHTQMILFLNKCDLLQAKLQRGVRIRDSIPSYGDRKNDLPTATKYFQQHFKEMLREKSPIQRPFYVFLTSIIDVHSTAITLSAVEESILREHLRCADLM